MPTRRIYVDFDDVLCQTAEAIRAMANRDFQRKIEFKDIASFNIARSFNLTVAQVERLMSQLHAPQVLSRLEPMPGAADVLRLWVARGREVVIVTGRPPSSRPASEQWLRQQSIPYAQLLFVDKYSRGKQPDESEYCVSMPELLQQEFALAIDDSPEMVQLLAERTSIPTVIFDRPWNAALALTGLTRLDTWAAVAGAFPAP